MFFEPFYDQIIFDIGSKRSGPLFVTKGDTMTRGIYIFLFIDQTQITERDLEDLSMVLSYKRPDGHSDMYLADREEECFRIDFGNRMFEIPGIVTAELTLVSRGGAIITSRAFSIKVEDNLHYYILKEDNTATMLDLLVHFLDFRLPEIEEAEEEKKLAEEDRGIAENLRTQAEFSRDQAESSRDEAEFLRDEAEFAREQAELLREQTEESRDVAEYERSEVEYERNEAESERIQSEESRAQSETLRVQSEESRTQSETNRVQAEEERVQAEEERVQAEEERVQAEEERMGFSDFKVNNEVINGNFSEGIDEWESNTDGDTVLSHNEGGVQLKIETLSTHGFQVEQKNISFIETDIYYVMLSVKSNRSDLPLRIYSGSSDTISQTQENDIGVTVADEWISLSGTLTDIQEGDDRLKIGYLSAEEIGYAVDDYVILKDIILINLSELLMTKKEADALINELGWFNEEIVPSQRTLVNWFLTMIRD